jgi:mono/diheme cytochrome c family protein
MRVIRTLIIAAVIVTGATIGFIYSGLYNVAATVPHTAPVYWALDTLVDRSMEHHAEGIQAPDLKNPAMIRVGFDHYNEMCVVCHGAPGHEKSELAQGLYPQPPDLAESVKDLSPAELFWTIKNGIKMTGMPAWGVTHSDDKIWAMVAFIETLPQMTPAQYEAMAKANAGHDHDDDHDH